MNVFTVIGIIAVIYVLVRYVVPAIFAVTAFVLTVLFYAAIAAGVIILILYVIGSVSRRTRKKEIK